MSLVVIPDRFEDPSSRLLHVAWIVLMLAGGIGVAASNVVGWVLAIVATFALAAGIAFVYVMAGGGDPTLLLILLPGIVVMLAAFSWTTTLRWAVAQVGHERVRTAP